MTARRSRRGPLALGVLFATMVPVAAAAQTPQDLYPRGLMQEHANGDLKQAIALYAQVVQTSGTDRALAAKALIRMAGSHEKLGSNAEAQKTYAQLLRAYPEQLTEVARARERLKALRDVTSRDVAFFTRSVHHLERAPDTELARRLAGFLWSGAPDAALLQAAKLGELTEPAALSRQVTRMLRDPRAGAFFDNFFGTWLSLDRLREARPDPSVFPQADAELLESMRTETRLFVRSQVHEDRDAVELWIAPYTFVNERLARHYGLSGIRGKDFKRVTWPDSNRAGLLGQAGPLMALSTPSRTSPTMRGAFVINRFLGADVPQPPANIPPLAERAESHETMRERLITHRTNPACASCHAQFDPVGLALENFDAIGRWRTEEGGSPIDASGALNDGTRFNGPAELRVALLKYRGTYYTNVTERLLAYALNRKGVAGHVYDYEMPVVRQIVRDASEDGYRWSSIIAGIVASAPFQAKDVVP